MSIVESQLMTTEQLLLMPDDGVNRELIRGELKECAMTVRNRFHTYVVAEITFLLNAWRKTQASFAGEVHTGEVGAILRRDPDTTVGIDVAVFSAELIERQGNATTLIDGAPILAVEVLSPSDKQEDIHAKVLEYLACGVHQVWLVDPYFQTVQVHRPATAPETFNREQSVTGGDDLPGLQFSVADIFPPATKSNSK